MSFVSAEPLVQRSRDLNEPLNTILSYVGFEVLAAVVMKVVFFWDTAPCSPYVNRCFRGTYHLHLQGRKSAEQETSLLAGGLTSNHSLLS
jgi:hypothetical protein